jgi:hypothetical protein
MHLTGDPGPLLVASLVDAKALLALGALGALIASGAMAASAGSVSDRTRRKTGTVARYAATTGATVRNGRRTARPKTATIAAPVASVEKAEIGAMKRATPNGQRRRSHIARQPRQPPVRSATTSPGDT